jgi:hypothetical protein
MILYLTRYWSHALNESSTGIVVYDLTATMLEAINLPIPYTNPKILPFYIGFLIL